MTILHDPLLKSTTRSRLYSLLYTPADNRLWERLKAIIMRNAVLVGASHASFMYKAVNYSCDENKILPRPRNQLDPRLVDQMQEYLADAEDLTKEKPIIVAHLTQVLNASDHPADWLKLLIPALHEPVQALLAENTFDSKRMSDAAVEAFLEQHRDAVRMTKARLVTNLITV